MREVYLAELAAFVFVLFVSTPTAVLTCGLVKSRFYRDLLEVCLFAWTHRAQW